MDSRLEEACRAGDVDALRSLLQEDSLLLDRLAAGPCVLDGPLHVAALLGHADFAKEILRLKPGLAGDLGARGLSPLHLASAAGHLAVVKELIDGRSNLCLVKDGDGWLPIHRAASRGRARVVAELMEACPESAHQVTYRGETILHLAVKSSCFEVVELVVSAAKTAEGGGGRLLNLKDERGNTVLHLAATRRQAQTIRLLLGSELDIDVNAVNNIGLNPLDVLLESSEELGDLGLCEMILASGGKPTGSTGARGDRPPQPQQVAVEIRSTLDTASMPQRRTNFLLPRRWFRALRFGRASNISSSHTEDRTPGTLMVVASLIATITFQAVLNPPGGWDEGTGKAKLGDKLPLFMILDTVGLFASLSIILLFICSVPRRKRKLTRVLVWVMWLAVFCTLSAFSVATNLIFQGSSWVLLFTEGLNLILSIAAQWIFGRFTILLLRKVGWWENIQDSNHTFSPLDTVCAIKGILALLVIGLLLFDLANVVLAAIPMSYHAILIILCSCVPFAGLALLWICVLFAAFILRLITESCKKSSNSTIRVSKIGFSLIVKRILVLVIITVTLVLVLNLVGTSSLNPLNSLDL